MSETAMADFSPEALIERWTAAYKWASGHPPLDPLVYETGYFQPSGHVWFCLRRKALIQMITNLENRPKK
jgi:hypothetical protein